jgi:DNA-binding transcriptional ArsR family regulator
VDLDGLAAQLRSLAEPTRLRLLALCASAPAAVSALAAALGEPEPAVSRHLKSLAQAGLLRRVRRGQRVEYSGVEHGAAAALAAEVLRQLPPDDSRLNRARRSLAVTSGRARPSRSAGASDVSDAPLGAALVSLLPEPVRGGSVALVGGEPPAELLRALAARHTQLIVAADTVAARTRLRRRLAEAGIAGEVLLSGDARTVLRAAPPQLCCVDLRDCSDWAAGEARLRRLQRLQDPDAIVLLLVDYELVEGVTEAGRAPLNELRMRLQAIGLEALRIHPVEADGRHRLFVQCAARRLDRLRAA